MDREFSIESDAIGNGALRRRWSKKLGTDLLGRGMITLSTLDVYVLDRVKDLTGGRLSRSVAAVRTLFLRGEFHRRF